MGAAAVLPKTAHREPRAGGHGGLVRPVQELTDLPGELYHVERLGQERGVLTERCELENLRIDTDAGDIYWTDTRTGTIYRGDMDGTGPPEILASNLDGPWALALVPEPATLILFGTGAIMLRKRKQSHISTG